MTIFIDSIPCLLCGRSLQQRRSKKGKPYFVCNPCGVQLFIRCKLGMEKLEELKKAIPEHSTFGETPQKLLEVQQAVSVIKGIEKAIADLEKNKGFIFFGQNEVRIKQALQEQLESAIRNLEGLGKDAAPVA